MPSIFQPLLASGTGSGTGINFILNPDAESDTSGWATYADAAGATPVDGTGGAPTVTWTRSTSTPLTGTASFLFTKDAANRQGEGASYNFTIDSASQAKVLAIEFDYIIGSGTFVGGATGVDSDIEVYIYDVTNAVVIQPSTYKLFSNSSTTPSHFIGNFQSASNSTSYRLIFHTATTSASAYTVKFDTVQVGPSKYVYGTPITDWASYTPVFTAFGTAASISFWYRRVGDSLEINGVFTTGTVTGSEARISLPTGLTSADSTKIPTLMVVGKGNGSTSTTTFFGGFAVLAEQSKTYLTFAGETSTTAGVAKSNASAMSSNSTVQSLFARVPIAGWSSTVQMSDSADQRVVALVVVTSAPTATITGSNSLLKFGSGVAQDTHNGFSTSTGLYTVPVAGFYRAAVSLAVGATYANTNYALICIAKNGTAITGTAQVAGAAELQLYPMTTSLAYYNAGDTISPQISSTGNTPVVTSNSVTNWFTVEKVTGPSSIGATETIAARYTNTAGTSIANSGDVQVPFATKDFDTHGAFATPTFTAPSAGKYRVSAVISFASSVYAANNIIYVAIYKNGAVHSYGQRQTIQAIFTNLIGADVTSVVNCVAGDTIDIRAQNTRTAAATLLSTTAGDNHLEIERIGL